MEKDFQIFIFVLFTMLFGFLHCCQKAMAFSFMVTKDYKSCSQCHVSPAGGDLLNEYGRSMSAEVLSTWSIKNAENLLALPQSLPSFINLGGDFRWLNLTENSETQNSSKLFWMQTEFQGALEPIPGLTLFSTMGKYAEGDKYEYRRSYALLRFNENVSTRFGRFFINDGLGLPDHTAYISPDEGTESYAGEINLTSRIGEITATKYGGREITAKANEKDGYLVKGDDNGYVFKLSFFLIPSGVIGTSYASSPERGYTGKLFGSFGYYSLYFLSELDHSADDTRSFTQLGYEIVKGLHLQTMYQYKTDAVKYGGSIEWFPFPHLEFLSTYERELTQNDTINRFLFLGHYYL